VIRHEEQKKAQAKANEEEKENLEREMNGITVRVKPTLVVRHHLEKHCTLRTDDSFLLQKPAFNRQTSSKVALSPLWPHSRTAVVMTQIAMPQNQLE
jgi:hypothetical protein